MEPDVAATKAGPGLVTYRALVGAMLTIILALVATMGSDIRDTLRETTKTLGAVQTNVAVLSGRVDEQGSRVIHNEQSIQSLSEKTGVLDNRVTVLERRVPRYQR
jgi:hypothetical protein